MDFLIRERMDCLTLSDLPDELRQRSPRWFLAKGQILVQQNEPTEWLFWIESGRIRLVSFIGDQMITHYFAEANSFFCESSLYCGSHECSAIAEVPSEVIAIPKGLFAEALRQTPELHYRYQANLARKFRYLRALLELRSIRPARNRLLRYLMSQSLPNNPTIIIRKPLKEIAGELDLTPESLSRVIAQLQMEGKIIRKRRSFTFSQSLLGNRAQ